MRPGEPLPIGRMLDGRYRIHKVLGQGGMGRVYLANDTRLANRPVAVKEMIVGDGLHEQKAIEDFAREARVLALISHPGIPQLIDYFAENNRHYLVMEFVAGGDLQGLLDKLGPKGRLPERVVLRWARQILDVLHFLHSQKPPIIYRDLKPGNIMIDKSGHAMLVDFGIARFLPPGGGRGTQIGSVGYAPPEQYMGKTELRSDLYSLAATMHHLLSGRDPQLEPPFSFPRLCELAPEVSAQTERAVMSALDKDVNKRPASARRMLDLLPDPGPDSAPFKSLEALVPAAEPPRASAAPIASMATLVLDKPIRSSPGAGVQPSRLSSAAAPAKPNVLKAMARMPTQRNLPFSGAPVSKAAKVSPTAKTKDLRRVAKGPAASAPSVPSRFRAAKLPRPGARPKAGEEPSPALSDAQGHPASRLSAAATSSAGSPPKAAATADRSAATSNGASLARPIGVPQVAGARLVAVGHGAEFGITGTRMVIGRGVSSADAVDIDLSTLKHGVERVSRRHAEIIKHGADYYIRDLSSLNGTYIAGRGRLGRDQLYKLKDRDELVVGGAKLEFRRG